MQAWVARGGAGWNVARRALHARTARVHGRTVPGCNNGPSASTPFSSIGLCSVSIPLTKLFRPDTSGKMVQLLVHPLSLSVLNLPFYWHFFRFSVFPRIFSFGGSADWGMAGQVMCRGCLGIEVRG